MKTLSGFTIIELMMVLVIASILVLIAVPAMTDFVNNNRMITQTNALVTDMNLARSEAIKRNTQVVLCARANPLANPPACDGTAKNWSTGWLIFAEGGVSNGTYEAATDELIRVGNPAAGSIEIRSNAQADKDLRYAADGTTNEDGLDAIFALCDVRKSGGTQTSGRQITVSALGRPTLTKGVAITCVP